MGINKLSLALPPIIKSVPLSGPVVCENVETTIRFINVKRKMNLIRRIVYLIF